MPCSRLSPAKEQLIVVVCKSSDINASNITANGATISWTTNLPTTSIVSFGLNEKFGFELYDVTGRLQQSIAAVDNNMLAVRKGLLCNGVYLYRIIVAGKPVANGKLIIE